jgi:hypothetical protein
MILAVDMLGGATVWPSLLALVGGVTAAVLAYRQSTKVAKLAAGTEAQKIDGAAYDRARALMELGNIRLQDEIARLERKIARFELEAGQDASEHIADRTRIAELERHVARMQIRLIRAGLENGNGSA